MPLEAIPAHLGLAASDIEMLAGLPEGYFRGRAPVVPLARLPPAPQAAAAEHTAAEGTVVPFRNPRTS